MKTISVLDFIYQSYEHREESLIGFVDMRNWLIGVVWAILCLLWGLLAVLKYYIKKEKRRLKL